MTTVGEGGWSEGRDGSHRSYRERLYPPIAVFILVIGLATLVGVAYGAAYGAAWGWGFGILMGAIGLGVLLATSTPIHVDDRVVRVGRARLPLTSVAGAEPLDREAMQEARRHGDPRDYLVLRAWSSRRGVLISLDDVRDPHPRWVVTSRHPERLAQAVGEALASGVTQATDPRAGE